jgi:hypothetical protein
MACAVTGEECDGCVVVLKDVNGRGRVTPWRGGVVRCDRGVAREGLESCAAYYCYEDFAYGGVLVARSEGEEEKVTIVGCW